MNRPSYIFEELHRVARDLRMLGYFELRRNLVTGEIIVGRIVGSSIVLSVYADHDTDAPSTVMGYAVERHAVDADRLAALRRGEA